MLRPAQADQIERECNDAIRAAHAVRPRLLDGAADLEAAQRSPLFRGKLPPPEKMQACRQQAIYETARQSQDPRRYVVMSLVTVSRNAAAKHSV